MLYIAVVLAGDEICHVTADTSASGLARRLGTYVGEQADYQLDHREAARARELLAAGRADEAVELYFRQAGRWAPEHLETWQVDLEEGVPTGP